VSTLLVIGGSGFFGKSILSAFQRGLLASWGIETIKVLARTASKLSLENPELLNESIELIDDDIAQCTVLPKADFVIHAAASTDISRYLAQPIEEQKNIQASILNFCKLAHLYHSNAKIIYASSGAIYGPQPAETPFLLESSLLGEIKKMAEGKQHYAAAKRDAETAIQELGISGLSVSIARCFAFVGRYLPRDQHFAIGNFIEDGLTGNAIKVSATKPVYRSYMYADDLVEWLMTIAHSSNPQCPIYNVGSSDAVEIRELAQKVGNYFRVNVEVAACISSDADRYVPSVTKAFTELGLRCKFDLPSSISETVKQIRSA
jgi:nucleoside-diphosphate-sugar epimerase